MSSIDSLLEAISPRIIAKRVHIPHDEARASYPLSRNVVSDSREFEHIIGDYYNHHHASCISRDHTFPRREAETRAKAIVEVQYKKYPQPLIAAFNEALEGTNGGLKHVLDLIADSLKYDATRNYIRSEIHRSVRWDRWEQKVELIRQLIRAQPQVLRDYQGCNPNEFASDYEPLVQAIVEALSGVQNAMLGVGRAP